MQTHLADFIKETPEGRDADAILRKCVHCGFCNATCPTYRLLGDELDGPRGRIYLMKQVFEGAQPTVKTQLHLDRCLTCRACETTCPSGVEYGRLLDIARPRVEDRVHRGWLDRLVRIALRAVVPRPALLASLVGAGRVLRPLFPNTLSRKIPLPRPTGSWPRSGHARKMLVLGGCAQRALSPQTNAATARVLDRLGIELVAPPRAGCCGAVAFHLSAHDEATAHARRNIDAWWPYIEGGVEAILTTASGCGAMVADYGSMLANDRDYAAKAERVSKLARDVSTVIAGEKSRLNALLPPAMQRRRFAFHAPCTLQHALREAGAVERLLEALGFELTTVPELHQCCGAAGAYFVLQPALSEQLLANKIMALTADSPDAIVTANIGCQLHLQSATELPVTHWIEALDARLAESRRQQSHGHG